TNHAMLPRTKRAVAMWETLIVKSNRRGRADRMVLSSIIGSLPVFEDRAPIVPFLPHAYCLVRLFLCGFLIRHGDNLQGSCRIGVDFSLHPFHHHRQHSRGVALCVADLVAHVLLALLERRDKLLFL